MPEAWLANFVELELKALLQRKDGKSKSASCEVHAVPSIKREYHATNNGLKICCKDDSHAARTVLFVEFLDNEDVISAVITDNNSLLRAKFSRKAGNLYASNDTSDRLTLRPGSSLRLTDFEFHLTLYGDEKWNISLLINGFSITSTGAVISEKSTPIVAANGIRRGLEALLSQGSDRDSTESSKHKASKASPEVIEIESDIASQDDKSSVSLSPVGSQVGFATQTQTHKMSKSRTDSDMQMLSGVNLSAPRSPKRRRLDAESSKAAATNAQQLLSLIGRQNMKKGKTAEFEPKSNVQARTIPQGTRLVENEPAQPEVAEASAAAGSKSFELDHFSTHEGRFEFARYAKAFNGPDAEQRKLLRDPASWQYPNPGYQFPGVNVPVEVLTSFRSQSAKKTAKAVDPPNDPELYLEASPQLSESSNEATKEKITTPQKDNGDCSEEDLSESPSTENYSWPPSSSPRSSAGHPDEPKDSSIERTKFAASSSRRRRQPSSSPIDDLTQRPKSQGDPVSMMARQAKREFRAARRSEKQLHGSPKNKLPHTFSDDLYAEKAKARDCSPESLPSSPPVQYSSQRMVLQIRSPDTAKTSKAQLSPGLVPSALFGEKAARLDRTHQTPPHGSWQVARTQETGRLQSTDPSVIRKPLRDGSVVPASSILERKGSVDFGQRIDPDEEPERIVPDAEPFSSAKSSEVASASSMKSKSRGHLPWTNTGNEPLDQSIRPASRELPSKHIMDRPEHSKLIMRRPQNRTRPTYTRSIALSKIIESNHREVLRRPAETTPTQNRWWVTDDTVFKQFGRDYASLKALDGGLGSPGGPSVLNIQHKNLNVLEWWL